MKKGYKPRLLFFKHIYCYLIKKILYLRLSTMFLVNLALNIIGKTKRNVFSKHLPSLKNCYNI